MRPVPVPVLHHAGTAEVLRRPDPAGEVRVVQCRSRCRAPRPSHPYRYGPPATPPERPPAARSRRAWRAPCGSTTTCAERRSRPAVTVVQNRAASGFWASSLARLSLGKTRPFRAPAGARADRTSGYSASSGTTFVCASSYFCRTRPGHIEQLPVDGAGVDQAVRVRRDHVPVTSLDELRELRRPGPPRRLDAARTPVRHHDPVTGHERDPRRLVPGMPALPGGAGRGAAATGGPAAAAMPMARTPASTRNADLMPFPPSTDLARPTTRWRHCEVETGSEVEAAISARTPGRWSARPCCPAHPPPWPATTRTLTSDA